MKSFNEWINESDISDQPDDNVEKKKTIGKNYTTPANLMVVKDVKANWKMDRRSGNWKVNCQDGITGDLVKVTNKSGGFKIVRLSGTPDSDIYLNRLFNVGITRITTGKDFIDVDGTKYYSDKPNPHIWSGWSIMGKQKIHLVRLPNNKFEVTFESTDGRGYQKTYKYDTFQDAAFVAALEWQNR